MVKSKKLIDSPGMKLAMEVNDDTIRIIIREILSEQDISLSELSRRWGMSPPLLSDFLNGKRPAGPKITEPLGLEKIVRVTYRLQPRYLKKAKGNSGAK